MKNKRKNIIYNVLVYIIILGISYLYSYVDKNYYLNTQNADTSTFYGTGILIGDDQVTQTFVSPEKNIDGVNVKISLTGNMENVVLNYAIIDETTGVSYSASVPAIELENNKFNTLWIPTITNAKNKPYKLVLNVENSYELNGISFYAEHGVKGNQRLVIMGNESEGTLVSRIVTSKFDVETFVVVISILIFIVAFMKVLYKAFK